MSDFTYYHTFDHQVGERKIKDARRITIGILIPKTETGTRYLRVGYSVCHSNDLKTFDKELAHKIAIGRANNSKSRLATINIGADYAYDKGILKAIARKWERRIINDPQLIKGLRP